MYSKNRINYFRRFLALEINVMKSLVEWLILQAELPGDFTFYVHFDFHPNMRMIDLLMTY